MMNSPMYVVTCRRTQDVWKWNNSALHVSTARLVETLASPYHVVAALPPHCVPLLRQILGGQTGTAFLASKTEEFGLECPIVFDFLFQLSYHEQDKRVPDSVFPLLQWLCAADDKLFATSTMLYWSLTNVLD